ncbi:YmfQ family protein [Robbsia andropogonis]|uniref:YmfQ family protein n=1 Tax=Robbsia andropogonis TaxID=28092 RepID=UPI003D1DB071
MTSHADLLARLLPPVAYDPNGANLQLELTAEGNALDAANTSADKVLGAITPWFASELLPDWERVLNLTPSADATVQQRIVAAVAKINETGGLSIPYFKSLASSLGYTIEIVEPQPFRVGTSRIGDVLYIDDVIFIWQVVVDGAPSLSYAFRVGQSYVGERLMSFADPVLETTFEDLKPAHTYVYFSYKTEA